MADSGQGSAVHGAGDDPPAAGVVDYAEQPGGDDQRAFQSPAAWARFVTPAVLGLAADLWVKSFAFPQGMSGQTVTIGQEAVEVVGRHPTLQDLGYGMWVDNPPAVVMPHVLGFTTTVNHGAVFGIFQGWVGYFLVFSLIAMGVILWVFLGSWRRQWTVHIALGMITAGALGNLFDRAVFGGVRDMFKFYVSWYPYIFNIADVLLCVGVPLLMLRWMIEGEGNHPRAIRAK